MDIAVLVSGSGTLLEAMIEAGLPVRLVLADRPCRGLDVASAAGIEPILLERDEWGSDFDRDGFGSQVVEALQAREIDLVAMAGFGTILGAPVFDAFPNRIINTHPHRSPVGTQYVPQWSSV